MFNWGQSKNNEKVIRILKSGVTKKYMLTNTSELQLNMMHTKAINKCNWVVNVKEVNETSYTIELFTLENVIVETNNPMVYDLAAYKNVFSEVYNELVLEIDFLGKLLKVKNASLLEHKWQRVRQDLSLVIRQNPQLGSVISLNDTLFSTHENIKSIVGAMEFFELFFAGFYGKELPASTGAFRNNRLKSTPFLWRYQFSFPDIYHFYDTSKPLQIDMSGKMAQSLTLEDAEKVYGKFDFLSPKNFKPEFSSDGRFYLNRGTGMIETAVCNHYEIIDEKLLYTKNNYNLTVYE